MLDRAGLSLAEGWAKGAGRDHGQRAGAGCGAGLGREQIKLILLIYGIHYQGCSKACLNINQHHL